MVWRTWSPHQPVYSLPRLCWILFSRNARAWWSGRARSDSFFATSNFHRSRDSSSSIDPDPNATTNTCPSDVCSGEETFDEVRLVLGQRTAASVAQSAGANWVRAEAVGGSYCRFRFDDSWEEKEIVVRPRCVGVF